MIESEWQNAISFQLKRIAFFLLYVGCSICVKAQVTTCKFKIDSLTGNKIYTEVDSSRKTLEEVKSFLVKNYKWPNGYYCGEELLIARFLITEKGKVENIQLLKKSKFQPANDKFIRILNLLSLLTPGKCNGYKIDFEFIFPFRLEIHR
jgi:hypothetical protein